MSKNKKPAFYEAYRDAEAEAGCLRTLEAIARKRLRSAERDLEAVRARADNLQESVWAAQGAEFQSDLLDAVRAIDKLLVAAEVVEVTPASVTAHRLAVPPRYAPERAPSALAAIREILDKLDASNNGLVKDDGRIGVFLGAVDPEKGTVAVALKGVQSVDAPTPAPAPVVPDPEAGMTSRAAIEASFPAPPMTLCPARRLDFPTPWQCVRAIGHMGAHKTGSGTTFDEVATSVQQPAPEVKTP